MSILKSKYHFLTILTIGCSATLWAVYETTFTMPLLWLVFLTVWIMLIVPAEFKILLRRFSKIGLLLLIVSLVQIIFRRQGEIFFAIKGFPIVYSIGFREAVLLWIRFMIVFMLAYIFAQVSWFEFLLFLTKIHISLQLSLLLLTTVKFIPFIFEEAKKGLWSIRFRGIDLRRLSIKEKYVVLRKLLMPLLFRGVHYASFSALALELRGYGTVKHIRISQTYPLKLHDYCILIVMIIMNCIGILKFM